MFTSLAIGSVALSNVLSAIVTFLICLIVIKILMSVADKLLAKSTKLDGTLKGFVRSTINIVLWILAAIIVANALGINTASLVALVSVVGVALSLSVQNILANLFSGLTLLVTKPFSSGDFVEVSGKSGVIKTVGLFYTRMDTLDNVAISIPNSDITSSTVNNYSREPLRRVDMLFSASYEAETEKVKEAILEVIRADERILADPAPFVRLNAYKGSSIEYVVRVWVNGADYWNVYFDLNENVRESFARNGVQMSYEHVNVHIVEK